jgi:hypothetical protein
MKVGLIAAVVVGTAIAAIILYYQKRLSLEREVLSGDQDDFHSLSNGNGNFTRSAQHAMG